jgi:hypothetical protein
MRDLLLFVFLASLQHIFSYVGTEASPNRPQTEEFLCLYTTHLLRTCRPSLVWACSLLLSLSGLKYRYWYFDRFFSS